MVNVHRLSLKIIIILTQFVEKPCLVSTSNHLILIFRSNDFNPPLNFPFICRSVHEGNEKELESLLWYQKSKISSYFLNQTNNRDLTMGASSGSNMNDHNQPPLNMLPPRWPTGSHPSLLIASNPDQIHESVAESSSSREICTTVNNKNVKKEVSDPDKVSLQDIARERIDVISEKMSMLPDDYLQELKMMLRETLEGSSRLHSREDLFLLQKLVQTRSDLNGTTLSKAHRVQLEILVAINSGIQAFLHPNLTISQSALIEIFLFRRCRNIACQNLLPAEKCKCNICSNRKGFCNLCMCMVCSMFDFEVNTCRWIGCDSCSHWTHTECAIREKQICMGPVRSGGVSSPQMVFKCMACNQTSELLGWVKEVFQQCAPSWTREHLIKELEFVGKIFRKSEDSKGRKLFWMSEELVEKLNGGVAEAMVCRVISTFFHELGLDSSHSTDSGTVMAPQDACNKICEVVEEAIRKMEMVANEKTEMVEKARVDLYNCDRELEKKVMEIEGLKLERHQKKQQLEELERIVRLKQAEADMFQAKADEARREAESLQSIALAKSKRSEEEYAANYLKLRLSEAEAERQYLFEKIKLGENSSVGGGGENSMYSKIQDLLKNVYTIPASSEGKKP